MAEDPRVVKAKELDEAGKLSIDDICDRGSAEDDGQGQVRDQCVEDCDAQFELPRLAV